MKETMKNEKLEIAGIFAGSIIAVGVLFGLVSVITNPITLTVAIVAWVVITAGVASLSEIKNPK